MEKERPKIHTKDFKPGDTLLLGIESLLPDGTERVHPTRLTIEKTASGGFFGKVLFFKDQPFVAKTPDNDDKPIHQLFRATVMGREFPHFSSRNEALAEHLATKIIHNVIPFASSGKFYAPDSVGFTRLPNGHYAQIVERMDERPNKLGNGKSEHDLFRNAQRELTELAIKLGFEHVGQIHYDNPFGMSNIRVDTKTGGLVWLDTLPAIPHKGEMWPIPPIEGLGRFPFHYQIRDALNNGELTFNRIHTDILDTFLSENSQLFPPQLLDETRSLMKLYDKVWEEKQKEPAISNREEIKQALINLTKSFALEVLKFGPDRLKFFLKLAADPKFVDEVLLSGLNEAKKLNLVTQEEYDEAKEEFERDAKKRRAFEALYQYHLGSSLTINAIQFGTVFILAPILQDEYLAAAAITVGQATAPLVRPILALYEQARSGVDFRLAALVSAAPFFGAYMGVPSQLAVSEKKMGIIHHYKFRELVAKLSSLHPAGGWGTQKEAELYNKILSLTDALKKFVAEKNSSLKVSK